GEVAEGARDRGGSGADVPGAEVGTSARVRSGGRLPRRASGGAGDGARTTRRGGRHVRGAVAKRERRVGHRGEGGARVDAEARSDRGDRRHQGGVLVAARVVGQREDGDLRGNAPGGEGVPQGGQAVGGAAVRRRRGHRGE